MSVIRCVLWLQTDSTSFTPLFSYVAMAMTEPATTPPPKKPPVVHVTRGYQQELLQESLRKNIVIALDTGSGKTHIAMLRMKHEVEQQTKKVRPHACVMYAD